MEDKKSFVMYLDNKDVFYELNDKQAGRLIKAIFKYQETGEITDDKTLKPLFISLKTTFDRDNKKWEEIKRKRSEAGKKGMENRWGKDNKKYQNITNNNKKYQDITNITDSVSGSVNVNVSVSEKEKKKEKKEITKNNLLTPPTTLPTPTLDELRSYCLENDMGDFDYEKFFDYYEANGWQNKNGSDIKNWKAKVRSWYRDDKEQGKLKVTKSDRRLE